LVDCSIAKALLVASIALYYTLVVFNNLTDYDSNYQFVRHVLMMDSTFPGNRGMWRTINSPTIHTAFYISIIAWEILSMLFCWVAAVRLGLAVRSATNFARARSLAIAALAFGMLQWMVAFLTVGGEWFLMWQSHAWNGQGAAFREFAILGIVLIFVALPELESGPA
jgi:predicted small integral membrane protein